MNATTSTPLNPFTATNHKLAALRALTRGLRRAGRSMGRLTVVAGRTLARRPKALAAALALSLAVGGAARSFAEEIEDTTAPAADVQPGDEQQGANQQGDEQQADEQPSDLQNDEQPAGVTDELSGAGETAGLELQPGEEVITDENATGRAAEADDLDAPTGQDVDLAANDDAAAAAEDFREDQTLASTGDWVDVDGHRCWQPRSVGDDWQPYTNGYWAESDAGLCWESSEAWANVTYHYGRWFRHGHRWVWMPGRVWAPSWVAWREGDGCVGWAPLPPCRRGIEIDLVVGRLPHDSFCFVDRGWLRDRDVCRHYYSRRDNVRIINRTTNITNYTVINRGGRRVVSNSRVLSHVSRVSGGHFQPARSTGHYTRPASRINHGAARTNFGTGDVTATRTTASRTTGRVSTGHVTSGHVTSTRTTTGRTTTGRVTTGHTTTGHTTIGRTTTGHTTIGRTTTGLGTVGHTTTGHGTTGHLTPTRVNPTVSRPAHTTPTVTRPTHVSPTVARPTHVSPTVTRPVHTTPTITRPAHSESHAATISRPTHVNPTVSRPTHVSPTVSRPTHTTAVNRPTHVSPAVSTPTRHVSSATLAARHTPPAGSSSTSSDPNATSGRRHHQ